MNDERTEERDRPPSDASTANPEPSAAVVSSAGKPPPSGFETEWDDAPTTGTFRIPRL